MAGILTWELAEDLGRTFGQVALFTGHPDTLAKGSHHHVRVFEAPAYRREHPWTRIVSWLHYLGRAFFWLLRWHGSTPLLLFSNPPGALWLGSLMHLVRGQRYFVMVHDIYPDILIRAGILKEDSLICRLWRLLNQISYQRAECVMTLAHSMVPVLAKQFDPARTPARHIPVIPPWVDTDAIKPIPKSKNWFAQKHRQTGKLTVLYSGNMGQGHDIQTILEAAEILRTEPTIHFLLIGAGPKWSVADQIIRSRKLANVTLLPWQPESVLPYVLATGDIGLVSIEETIADLSLPSKCFYYLAAGVPVIVITARKTELCTFLAESGCGFSLQARRPVQLAQLLLTLSSDPGRVRGLKTRARQASLSAASRDNSLRIVRLVSELLHPPPASFSLVRSTERGP